MYLMYCDWKSIFRLVFRFKCIYSDLKITHLMYVFNVFRPEKVVFDTFHVMRRSRLSRTSTKLKTPKISLVTARAECKKITWVPTQSRGLPLNPSIPQCCDVLLEPLDIIENWHLQMYQFTMIAMTIWRCRHYWVGIFFRDFRSNLWVHNGDLWR